MCIRDSNKHHSMLMGDISRNLEHYEAACLFLAVHRVEGTDYQKTKRQSKKAQKKKDLKSASAKGELDDNDDNNDVESDIDENPTLSESSMIIAANLREGLFAQILEKVNEYIEDVEVPISSITTTISDVLSLGTTIHEPITNDTSMDVANRSKRQASVKFTKWKNSVLKEARDSLSSSITDEKEMLQSAADNMLRQFDVI